jgi:hypothetical protein
LQELLTAEGRSEARIVAHLAEVDARRIHLKGASPSLFEYCQKQLGLSDCQAYYRIAAARVGQTFPVVFELLERREIHLTNIAPLAKHLTTENHLELLGEAGRLSKRELLRWLARRYPQPQVASGIRKLPPRELVPKPGTVSAGPTGSLEPRSESHYRLQLNMPERVKDKLEQARDLMSHANPSGDLAVVVERGLDLLLAQLQKARFGQTASCPRKKQRPRTRPLATKPLESDTTDLQGTPKPDPAKPIELAVRREHLDRSKSVGASTPFSRPQSPPKARSHIPSERKRQLVARDGLCCSYVRDDGVRCTARAFLQIDHKQPWAKGGPDTLDNLRLLCRAHNLLQAEADFGKAHVRRAIAEQRLRLKTPR